MNARLAVAAAAVFALGAAGVLLGGELGHFVVAGVEALPFAVLAVLAYLGITRTWARVAALLCLGGIVFAAATIAFLASFSVVLDAPDEGARPLVLIALGLVVSIVIGTSAFLPTIRRAAAQRLPIDPGSFVHAVALAAVLTLTLASFVPLAVLGEPPLLASIAEQVADDEDPLGPRGRAGALRDELYGLVWLVPSAVFAVGFGVRRTLGQSLRRLGLVRPTRRQVLGALGLALALVFLVDLFERGVEALFETMDWPGTDAEAFDRLFEFAISPIGAVVVGVTAGLGEELAVRGVLQPRVGILLSNLFFVGLHAFQYGWDALLSVFVVGLLLGVLRQRTNTSTSAIVHGVYDFLLIMAEALEIPEPF